MPKKKLPSFPKTVYVRWEEEDEPFMLVIDDINDCVAVGDTVKIGIYKLDSIGTATAEAKLT